MVPTKFKRHGHGAGGYYTYPRWGRPPELYSVVLNEFGDTVGGDLSNLTNGGRTFYGTYFRNFNMTFPNVDSADNILEMSIVSGDVTLNIPKAYRCQRTVQQLEAKNVTINAPVAKDTALLAYWSALDTLTVNAPNSTQLYTCVSGTKIFRGNLPKVKNADDFCGGSLEEFDCDLPSLETGNNFINQSRLTAANIDRIFTSLPTYTDGSSHNIDIKNTPDFVNAHPEIARAKGWSVNGIR